MSGKTRNQPHLEAAWWTETQTTGDQHKTFTDADDARAWLREHLHLRLSEWIIRRRSPDGWRTVASGTAADLRA